MAQRNRPPLQVIYESQGDDVQVDIIAVHGLGANVDWSWTWKDEANPRHLVKWLEDLDMLPAVVPRSRIMLYNYNSRWHVDAPKTRLQLCGEDLVRTIHAFRRGTADRPIVFVGHSLGGNVIQHGLLYANSEDDFKDVVNSTVGLVFLGSPFRGTKLQFLPYLLTAIMQPAGSHDGIIRELPYDDPGLRDKLQSFCRMLNTLSIPTSCFFELYESDYGRRGSVTGVIKGMVVEEASACIPGFHRIPLQADHFKMNKFSGPDDRSFLGVSEEIRRVCADALNIVQRRMQPKPIITDRDYILTHRPEARDCLRALFLSDPFEDLKEMRRKKGGRATGTCDWILGTEVLTAWLDNKHGATSSNHSSEVIWLYGNPGTGKSSMSMFLAEELSRTFSTTTQKTLAYFFCDSGYDTRKTATAVIRGLLLQLLQQHPSLLGHVLPKFEERGAKAFDSFDALWAMFMNAAADKTTGRKYCIVDALDECEQESQEILLNQIQEMFGPSRSSNHELNLRLLITSRPYPEIRESLGEFANKNLSSFEESKRDIDKFIDEKVAHLKKTKRYTVKLADQVAQMLREKSENIFLWVGLACEELASKRVASKDAVRFLQAMPRGLHSLYKRLLDTALESAGNDGVTIKRLLSVVAVARRPLGILELAAACELYPDEDKEEREQFTTETIESCRLMVVVQDGLVLLLHQSVRDFLFSPIGSSDDYFIRELEAHASFATRCVDYLIRHFQLGTERHGEWESFLSYATRFWPDHARMAESEFQIEDAQAEFFVLASESREAWLRRLRSETFDIPDRFSVFHVAARWGIAYMVDYALLSQTSHDTAAQTPEFVDSVFINDSRVTPLEEAATSGYIAVARRMLDRAGPGMRVSERVILAAARNLGNGDEVMALLLNRKGGQITITEEVVIAAAQNEQSGDGVMTVLLALKGDQITVTEEVVKAAARNTWRGHEVMVLLLHREEYQITITEEFMNTIATFFGSQIMALLLDCQGDLITITEEVVKAAAQNERSGDDVVALLLDRRGDQVTITEEVVKAAAENVLRGHEVMTLLLDRRGDQIFITEEVMKAAARNKISGHKLMALLLARKGDQVTITKEVVIAAVQNERSGDDVMAVLLARKGGQITITEEVVEAAAENVLRGHEVMTLLLDRRGDQITITEEVVKAAAQNERSGDAVMAVLLARKGGQITVTEEIVESAAANIWHGHEVMALLLDRRGNQTTVTEGAVNAIAASFGPQIMALLLDRKGDQTTITEEIIKATAWNKTSGYKLMG